MIRINLLPEEKARRTRRRAPTLTMPGAGTGGSPTMWWIIYGVAVVVWLAVLGTAYVVKQGELTALLEENGTLTQERDELQKKTEGLAEVEAKLAKSKQLEEIVNDLERARTGPTRAVMELSRLLSSPGGPSIDPDELERLRKDNPLAGYNEDWNVRRLWIKRFEEVEGECTMAGMGRTNDDVAEFLRRLTLSDLFGDVTLERTRSTLDQKSGLNLIGFDLSCTVKY